VRRLVIAAWIAASIAGCSRGPFAYYAIEIIELRSAPRLDFLRAHNDMTFLQIVFTFHNDSGESLELTSTDFSLRDTRGRLHPFSAQVLDMGQRFHSARSILESGEKRQGAVVFQIPRGAEPAEMIYRQDVEGGLVVSLASSD